MRRRQWLKWAATLASALSGPGCQPGDKPPIRLAAHPWPGYELLFLARERNLLDSSLVRLVETPTASANIRALGSRIIEAACMTLDEVLTTRDRGIPLTIVALLDISLGADVLLADSSISSLRDLKGKRVGVEHTALGAVMLESALARAGLTVEDIQMKYVTMDEHEDAVDSRAVSAVVTFEPVKTRLLNKGMKVIYSSASIPGQIVDVIAVRSDLIAPAHFESIRELVQGHFRGLGVWREGGEASRQFLARRLGLRPEDVAMAFSEIELPDIDDNRGWMTGPAPRLADTAAALGAAMLNAGLLPSLPGQEGLIDSRFLSPTVG